MKKAKVILASIAGTSLEFYDFMLYAVCSERIGKAFFPAEGEYAFMAGWMAFALAFIARPFGGSVFGYIGDVFGRKKALVLTVSCMGLPTFVIGVLPTYAHIGIVAPIVLVICRLMQGLCTGGEYNGSAIYTLEHVGKSYPGMAGGLITGASVIGALAATAVGVVITFDWMPEWSWRVAFMLGALISLVGLYIRLYMDESPAFTKIHEKKETIRSPLTDALFRHKHAVLTTMCIGVLNGTLSYTMYKFIAIYLVNYFNVSEHYVLEFTMIGIVTFIFCAPAWGFVLDKIGGQNMMRLSCIYAFLFAVPLFYLLQNFMTLGFIIAQILLGTCVASIAGPEHAFVQRLFPAKDRYSGVAFSFSLGMGIGASLSPLVMKYAVGALESYYAPSLVIMSVALLCFSTLVTYKGPYYDL